YGRSVGMAFQITDDILGVYGDPEKTGKPVYSDLREGKKTVVTIYALNTGDEEIRRAVLRVLGKPDAPDELLAKAADAIARSGALNYARGLAVEYSKKAVDALNRLGNVCDENAKRALLELADFVVRRER
ncbi:MAG TPA: polyprenyl synthetase family protein, partial [Chromatiaceae bacterium]|nr:polyprenyl synthetase family protein [Chromatiaceae bacterium]